MADFLGADWLVALNDTLASAGTSPLVTGEAVTVVLEFADGPATKPHALTFIVTPEGARARVGDDLTAQTVIRLSYRDAESLTNGTLESNVALREGRLKLRGDVHALVPLLDWLLSTHPAED